MKPLCYYVALAGATTLLLLVAPGRTHAAFLLTLSQSGANVVMNGSGSLNTTALTLQGSGAFFNDNLGPSAAFAVAGTTLGTGGASGYTGLTVVPTSFGPGGPALASSTTGSIAGVAGFNKTLFAPTNYVSGTVFTDSATFNNTTLAGLGFTPGTYTFSWGTGANADSLTVVGGVPEPSTWTLLAAGVTVFAAWTMAAPSRA